MIQDPEELRKLIEDNKYHVRGKVGRPKGCTKEKTKINPNNKLGRPIKNAEDYGVFDPNKKALVKRIQHYEGQHINRIVRYEIEHDNIKYLFSTLKQVEKEFQLTTNIITRLLAALTKKKNNIELSFSEQRVIEAYPKFTLFVKLPLDKSKRIIDVVRMKKENNNLKLSLEVPTN